MKVSLNTIKQYIKMELPPLNELVEKINSQLGAIEEIVDVGEKYKDALVVRVVSCQKHPDADKLSVCLVDDGGVRQNVPRDENGYVQVVCGAPNVHADMWAVWLPPSSTVPASFDDDEPFVLDARKLRGVLSQGMLAAADELAIGTDHEGIIEITERDVREGGELQAGASFAKLFGLDDVVIDIENKMFTHRPDLFGQLGVAREIAGIHHQPFASPEWYVNTPDFAAANDLELEVQNEAPATTPRFMTVAIKNVEVQPSPLWLQCELVRMGSKPINSIVDATNYVMLLTAQPVHAYDYDKLRGHKLVVRMASEGEKIHLLNDKTYELDADDIVIADGEGVVGLAGIMGGSESEVSQDTKNIVLEVANFDMYAVRRSSMRHGLFTDALTRFNKGQSPLQGPVVLAKLMELIGGEQASQVFDEKSFEHPQDDVCGEKWQPTTLTTSFINDRLGTSLSDETIAVLLENVEFDIRDVEHSGEVCVTAPFWRTDIELAEDVVEEIGRLYGYDLLPRTLPQRSTKPTATNAYRELTHLVRKALARAGANEVLTYSFVHEQVLKSAGQDSNDAYKLSNALSPELQYYRLSVTPSLLDKVHANIKGGYDEFALFEIGKSHSKKAGLNEEGLPVEPGRIALTYAAKTAKEGAAYYRVKQTLDYLATQLGLQLEYKPLAEAARLTAAALFSVPRAARVIDVVSGQAIGIVGEYTPAVRKAFKLPEYSAGFELFTEGLLLAQKTTTERYQPLSRYPSIERDICFEVSAATTYADVHSAAQGELAEIKERYEIEPVDIYGVSDTRKRITLRVRLTPEDNTMTSDSANARVDAMANAVAAQLDATII